MSAIGMCATPYMQENYPFDRKKQGGCIVVIKNNRKSLVLPTPEHQPLADSLSITYNFSFILVVMMRYSSVLFGKWSTNGRMTLP